MTKEHNAKRGTEPSNTSHARIVFRQIFIVLPTPFQKPCLDGQAPTYHRKCVDEQIFDFPGFQNQGLELDFLPNGVRRRGRDSEPERPGANLGAIWRQKCYKDISFNL